MASFFKTKESYTEFKESKGKGGNDYLAAAFPKGAASFQMGFESAKEAMKIFIGDSRNPSLDTKKRIAAQIDYAITAKEVASHKSFHEKAKKIEVCYYFTEAITNLFSIIVFCKKENEFQEEFDFSRGTLTNTVQSVINYAMFFDGWRTRCGVLEKFVELLRSSKIESLRLQLGIANEMVKGMIGLEGTVEDNWRSIYHLTEELNRPLCICDSLWARISEEDKGKSNDLKEELDSLRSSQQYFAKLSKSESLICRGLKIQQQILQEEEELNLDLTWDTADCFLQALQEATNENNTYLDNAARAASYLGDVYMSMLKLEIIGNRRLLQCFQIIDIIVHSDGREKSFHATAWFKRAKLLTDEYRKRREKLDSEEIKKQREPTLLKIKDKLDAMDKVTAKFESKLYKLYYLLEHVYKEHPPKASKCRSAGAAETASPPSTEEAQSETPKTEEAQSETPKTEEAQSETPKTEEKNSTDNGFPIKADEKDDREKVKKGAVKLVARYHTDRQENSKHGIEWWVLCEEITKRINSLYSDLKM